MSKEFEKLKLAYQKTIEKSLVISLAFLLILMHIFPKSFEHKAEALPPIPIVFEIEDIPITRQSIRRGQQPPQKPVIPVASEDPDVPMDATIDETIIDWEGGNSPLGNSAITAGQSETIPPRPIVQVLPEYPKELQKQNIRGIVRVMLYVGEDGRVQEAVVSENSTGNEACAKASLDAAKKSTYLPASIGGKKAAAWVSCTYTFKPD